MMKMQRRIGMIAAAALTLGALTITVAEHIAGAASAWTIVPSPNNGSDQVGFSSISCTSTRFCIGVGYDYGTTDNEPFSALWNGTMWSRLQNPAGLTNSGGLSSVSCVSPSWCIAVGDSGLAEVWNGQKWTLDTAKSPGTDGSELNGVSCVSKTWCVAVGWYDDRNAERDYAVVEWWNGKKWALMNGANNSGLSVSLYGISCTTPKFCAAAGSWSPPGKAPEPEMNLVEIWNGTHWSNSQTPSRAVQINALNSISCTSRAACTAVGYNEGVGGSTFATAPEVVSWNGTKWSFIASPNIGGSDTLSAVLCKVPKVCLAVGSSYGSDSHGQTLILGLHGSKWAVIKSPNRAGTFNGLSSISCILPSWCEAVGSFGQGYVSRTLVLRYG
jgi:hypothetical protein